MGKCTRCGTCCTTVGVEIETPETEEDFEDIKWYLYHKGLTVYIDRDGDWNVEIHTKCKHLKKNNTCSMYDNRPSVCKDYDDRVCDICDDDEVIEFKTAKDVDEHVKKLKEIGAL